MKATFIIRNLTEDIMGELADMHPDDRFAKLHRWAFGDLRHCVSVQFGKANAFRDRVEFNTARKNGAPFKSSSMEPRRGYKLATFEI
ncbi:hypothetical protein [Paracoccus sp. T5]|uniref:hypothetical protein n=1 Tax=Paracoccus sp. T5 TaxID=3402161 RepID=UPI003AEACFB6